MSDDAYVCVLPFVTDDPMFVRGVEIGMRYVELRDTHDREYSCTVHVENEEQLHLMATRMGWKLEMERLDDHWMAATFTRCPPIGGCSVGIGY